MFENVDGRTTDAGVTGILIAHLGAFGSGELKMGSRVVHKIFSINPNCAFNQVEQKICKKI